MPVRASMPRSLQPPPMRKGASAGVADRDTPSAETTDSLGTVILRILWKMMYKWPWWLQARMMKALIQGLPKGFVYGCAQGTLVGVEAGFSHTVADMTCAQVDLGMVKQVGGTVATLCSLGRPEVAAACSFAAMLGGNVKAVKLITCTMVDQGQYKQAVACSYETVLLGARTGREDIIANQTVEVASSELPAKASQPYINLLADVVASLVRDGFGEEAARVCLLVIASGNLRTATRISTTMVKRRHYCEAAKVSACLVAAGHEDFRATLAGSDRRMKGGTAVKVVHPHVAQLARRTAKVLTVAGIIGAALVVGTWPQRQRRKHQHEELN